MLEEVDGETHGEEERQREVLDRRANQGAETQSCDTLKHSHVTH